MNKPQNCGTTYCSCIECVMEDEIEEDEICSWCSGSGEGMYDGSTCQKCKGSGVEPVEKDEDDCYDID
jgi:DnaJ-class molecular chaperone